MPDPSLFDLPCEGDHNILKYINFSDSKHQLTAFPGARSV
jgi:hypothetical protein